MKISMMTTILAGAVALGACASTGGTSRYNEEMARLEADCRAQGGVLQTTGSQSNQAALDYACRATPATRLPPAR